MKVLRLTLLTALAAAYSTAGIITYDAALSGLNENPANASPGVGFAIVTVDTILNTMEVNVTFSGLTSGNTAAHIHCRSRRQRGRRGNASHFSGLPIGNHGRLV